MKSDRYRQARKRAAEKLWNDPEYRAKQKRHPWRSPIRVFENHFNRNRA